MNTGLWRWWNGHAWNTHLIDGDGWWQMPGLTSPVSFHQGSTSQTCPPVSTVVEVLDRFRNLGRVTGFSNDGCIGVHHHNHESGDHANRLHPPHIVVPTGKFHHQCGCRFAAPSAVPTRHVFTDETGFVEVLRDRWPLVSTSP